MTLILNFLSEEFVVQASDRRLTMTDGTIADEHATKAIFFCGHFTLGYTGLAEVEGKNMAQWIVEELLPCHSVDDAMHRLAERATQAFAAMRLPSAWKRTAIEAVGWSVLRGTPRPDITGELQATAFTISNFVQPDGTHLATAKPYFEPLLEVLRPGVPGSFHSVGQPLEPQEKADTMEALSLLLEQNAGREEFINTLVARIRSVAQRNSAVGTRVLVSLVPRSASLLADKGDAMISVQHLDDEHASSLYYGEEDDSIFAADYVCGGVAHRAHAITSS
jgi:hypothetical protein